MSDYKEASTLKLDNLDALIKALKGKQPEGSIGILGSKGSKVHKGSTQTNATIGAKFEFGDEHTQQRSFLRVPLANHLNEQLGKAGAFDDDALKEVIKTKSLKPWLEKVMLVALNVVLEGFATNGYGQWAPWKDPNYHNNTGMILVDTTQLRDSITTRVK